MAYLAFVSYARVNVDRTDPSDRLMKFLGDVRRRIEQRPDILGKDDPEHPDEPMFLDQTNIETGRDWNDELSLAAGTSRVVLAIYTPAYFTREYCGREFQVFLDRREMAGAPYPVSIVPVLWQPCSIPAVAEPIQWEDGAFPPSYRKEGLDIITRLGTSRDYERAVIAVEQRIVAAATQSLPELRKLDLKIHPAAFPQKQNGIVNGNPCDADSASALALKRARFVFLSGQGWDWMPYGNEEPIGVIAMDVAVRLKVRFEEIPCDASLQTTLAQAEEAGIPTLLIPDPSSVEHPSIKTEMANYDARLYDNCGLIVPWNTPSPGTDYRWPQVKKVCRRKIEAALLNHDWTGAVSKELFASKATAILEGLRLKRMKKLLDSGDEFAKAEDAEGLKAAEQNGLNINTAPQVSNVINVEGK